jgi:hypothetical protein
MAPFAVAAPVITSASGSLTHGATAGISGTGFGTKSTPAPYRYDDFEALAAGAPLAGPGDQTGGWSLDSSLAGYRPVASTAKPRGVGTKSAYQNFTGANYNSTIALLDIPSTSFYFSGWYNAKAWGAVSRNIKMFQIDDYNYWQSNWQARFGSDFGTIQQYVVDCGLQPLNPRPSSYPSNSSWHEDEQWHRVEFWFNRGTQNGNDGIWTIWLDGTQWSQVSGSFLQAGVCPTGFFYLGFYFTKDAGTPTPEMQRYWDELYVDTTRSRVEVGNASTWAACTHKEVQIPTAWNSNGQAISFRANQGTFSNGAAAWLYVVDANGTVNPTGYPVAFGGSATGAPGAPGKPSF